MRKKLPGYSPFRVTQLLLAALLLCALISACGGSPQSQQAANQNKAQLDAAIQQTGIDK